MLKDYNRYVDDVRARGGEVVGICAQTQVEADKMKKKLGVKFSLWADPYCAIPKMLNQMGWIKSTITTWDDRAAKLIGYDYQVGMLQPGMVALQGTTDGDDDPNILLSWGSVPTAENINGSTDRLKAELAWTIIQKSLTGDFSDAYPAVVQKDKTMPLPLPIFYTFLLAHGNFWHLKPFVANSEGEFNRIVMLYTLLKLAFAIGLTITILALWPIVGATLVVLYGIYVCVAIRPQIKTWAPR